MGFFDKIKKIGIFNGFSQLDDDFYDELEESLVMADMGAETTMEAVEDLRRRCKAEKIKDVEGARACMRQVLADYLTGGDMAVDMSRKPAVVYDAMSAAKARKSDVVLVDTAGRLHNKQNLMNELNKISRVIDRECPDSSRETLLVLDATTGQNGLIQAKQFAEAAGITGIVLTKLDGTAKGGIVIAIAKELGVPVKFVGVGEGVDDLQPFDAKAFTEALL